MSIPFHKLCQKADAVKLNKRQTDMLRELAWFWCILQEDRQKFQHFAQSVMDYYSYTNSVYSFRLDMDNGVFYWKNSPLVSVNVFRIPEDADNMFPDISELRKAMKKNPEGTRVAIRLMGGSERFGVERIGDQLLGRL